MLTRLLERCRILSHRLIAGSADGTGPQSELEALRDCVRDAVEHPAMRPGAEVMRLARFSPGSPNAVPDRRRAA